VKKRKAPAVHIPREHQSAPKKTDADIAVEKAAEEIRTGQFTPNFDEDDFLAVGLARGLGLKDPAHISGEEKMRRIRETADSMALAQHPRVQDALRQLAQEKREAKNSQELMEKTQMLHEMNERAANANKWDGQGRWVGKENEDMRVVNIMAPQQFLKKLEAVIGEGRVFLNRFAVAKRVALLVPNTAAQRSALWTPDQVGRTDDDKFLQVGTLQYPCGPEWMVPRFDEYGVIKNAKYLGWRTALLSMIHLQVVTEKEAHKAFPLGDGPAGDWYRQQLFEIRNRDQVVN